MEDLFQIYGASTKQEAFGGIFSKVKQSQTLQQPESLDYAMETQKKIPLCF